MSWLNSFLEKVLPKKTANKRSAKEKGWEPSWFGADDFNDELVENIKDFQKDSDILETGVVDEGTYRRIFTDVDAKTPEGDYSFLGNFEYDPNEVEEPEEVEPKKRGNYVVLHGEKVPIEWDAVVPVDHPDALTFKRGFSKGKRKKKKVAFVVTHWDVCLSAHSCHKVLSRRGISSHFVIDSCGKIYQMLDPQHSGWHAGGRVWNARSIGIDLSNAYHCKFQKTYIKRGFGPRPIKKNLKVHSGRIKECLGFYPVQVEAYKALIKTLCDFYDIPIQCPKTGDTEFYNQVYKPAAKGRYRGIVSHSHLTKRKIDVRAFDNMVEVIEEVRKKK